MPWPRPSPPLVLSLVLALTGCPSPIATPDAAGADAGVDAGPEDSGVMDSGVMDSGVMDSGVMDSGVMDSGVEDSGVVDAGAVDSGVDAGVVDAGPPVIIDFQPTSSEFPPSVNKIGFNSFWNSTSNNANYDAWTIRRSAKYRAPMIAGLIEPKTLTNYSDAGVDAYEEVDGDWTAAELEAQSCSLWQPGYLSALFFDNGGVIEARQPTDPDLLSIRALARTQGLITFLQVSGTPGLPAANPVTTRFNGLFTLDGEPTTDGNWYPLPIASELPALAHAFGTLPDALGYAAPTIYSFWQEPSHTIDESVSAVTSINRYANFYSLLSNELLTQCRWQRCPMAGAQLNSNDGDATPADGYRYKLFIDGLLARRAAAPTLEMPLDYFTIQNYAAQWNDEILRNSRIALGTSFAWTPVLMNEWDYCVNTRTGDGCTNATNGFIRRYDGDGTTSLAALRWLVDSIDRPDVSHVLLREKVMQDEDNLGAVTFPWTQVPILFLASMSEFRRPARSGYAQVPMIATGDDDQLRIILWNEGNVSRTLPLELRNIPLPLRGQVLSVKRISKAIRVVNCPSPADVMDANHTITCWEDAVAPAVIAGANHAATLTIAPGEVVMLLAGTAPVYASTLFDDNYVRSAELVKRDGTGAAPLGLAHFDPRTGSVTLGVRGGGVAAEKLTLKNVPDTLALSTRVASMGAPGASLVAGVRVDYLDANKVPVKSVFFRDARWVTSATPWTQLEWPALSVHSEVSTTLSGTNFSLDLLSAAPSGWTSSRDAVVGVVLTGATGDTTYRVDFP